VRPGAAWVMVFDCTDPMEVYLTRYYLTHASYISTVNTFEVNGQGYLALGWDPLGYVTLSRPLPQGRQSGRAPISFLRSPALAKEEKGTPKNRGHSFP
jgi:hypothetical protein